MKQCIYLDNASTTAVSPPVVEAMLEMFRTQFGNPSSLHSLGIEAEQAMERARSQTAQALGCQAEELIFTSGGTEANNLALLGAVAGNKRAGTKLITTAVEHPSVLEPLRHLRTQGYELVELAPLPDGSLDLEALVGEVDENTVLVSAMLVNSELGSVSDIARAVALVKGKNKETLFHTDAVQGFGKIPFTVRQLGVDLATISGHKVGASKGVGALFLKKGVKVRPLLFGGGHEGGLRAGTQGVPQIVGFGVAAERAKQNEAENYRKVEALRDYFVNNLKILPILCSNSTAAGTPYIQNVSLLGYRSEIILHYLAKQGVYLSSGSACSKGKKSHVLQALRLPQERIDSALRVSFSHTNTTEEIDHLLVLLEQAQQEIVRTS